MSGGCFVAYFSLAYTLLSFLLLAQVDTSPTVFLASCTGGHFAAISDCLVFRADTLPPWLCWSSGCFATVDMFGWMLGRPSLAIWVDALPPLMFLGCFANMYCCMGGCFSTIAILRPFPPSVRCESSSSEWTDAGGIWVVSPHFTCLRVVMLGGVVASFIAFLLFFSLCGCSVSRHFEDFQNSVYIFFFFVMENVICIS